MCVCSASFEVILNSHKQLSALPGLSPNKHFNDCRPLTHLVMTHQMNLSGKYLLSTTFILYLWLTHLNNANTISVAITSYTVSVYDWQHFKKLCDFSRSVCHLGFSLIRDSLFWCLASPGLSSLLRSEARHVCAHVYERCDSEKSASPSRTLAQLLPVSSV